MAVRVVWVFFPLRMYECDGERDGDNGDGDGDFLNLSNKLRNMPDFLGAVLFQMLKQGQPQ